MLLTKPDSIKFESKTDIVDYVTKGLPPTKKNFNTLMASVHVPTANANETKEGNVFIDENMFINCDQETFEEVMNRVYENRIRNRNISIGVGAGVIVLALLGVHKHNKNEDDDED